MGVPPFLSTLSGTVRELIQDEFEQFSSLISDFETSESRVADDMAESLADRISNGMLK